MGKTKVQETKAKKIGVVGVGKKKKRKNNPNHLIYKMAVRRMLKRDDKGNAVQASTYKIFDQMFRQVQTQILSQVVLLKNSNLRRKQTKQSGLKAFDVVNATMALIDDPAERARVRGEVIDALSRFHTYQEEPSQ